MILWVIIGVLLCLILILIPKVKHQEKINQDIIQRNAEAKENLQATENDLMLVEQRRDLLNQQASDLKQYISEHQEQADKDIESYYKVKEEKTQLEFENNLINLANQYEKSEEDYQATYLKTLKECVEEFQKSISDKQITEEELDIKIQEAKKELDDLRARVTAVIEASKRADETKNQKDFYRIVISEEDGKEVKELQEVSKHLRNPIVLNKLIWSTYYQRPLNDMINRVVGNEVKIGIYKITNLENGKIYIGQTQSSGGFSSRWKTHAKKALKAEDPGHNKLYPAMYASGVENWTFEILEECLPEQMNEREQYWISFYKSREWGYNIR